MITSDKEIIEKISNIFITQIYFEMALSEINKTNKIISDLFIRINKESN
jgi:hypothetical protein